MGGMSGQNQMGSGGYGDGQEMNIIYLSVGLIALLLILGFVFYAQLVAAVFFVKFNELKFVSFFIHTDNIQAVINWGNQIPYRTVKIEDLVALMNVVGGYFAYPIAFLGGLLGILLMIKHPDKGYDTIETMNTLRGKMGESFPVMSIVQGQDIPTLPVEEGPWAMALTPIEFAKKYHLLYRDEHEQIKVDLIRAKAIATKTLGALWRGIDQLPRHQRAIFGVLAAYAAYQRKDADKVLEKMAASATFEHAQSDKVDYAEGEALAKKLENHPEIKRITQQHAYVFTVFTELLVSARKTGIVANALYLWVKILDRPFWYVLNNVGRKAVYSETAAVHAHWLSESKLGYPIKTPMIDMVVDALEEAVASRIIKEI